MARSMLLFCLFACTPQNTYIVANETPQEPHRPHFHFTPPQMWMNDPNGMVFYDGEYHLFYQHYPDDIVWGPMHWGHAVSKNMVTWEHLPIALYPDSLGLIFSGSAVVDEHNTSGFKSGMEAPLVAIFTYHNMEKEKAGVIDFQYQGIAYSNDRGRTWTKYKENPVITNPGIRDFRDPKVFWHEPSQHWVMIFAARDRVKLYHSTNLKEWTFLSDFGENTGSHGGVWECPDLFELPVQGTNQKKWVMLVSINPGAINGGSGTQYFVGHFDGTKFTLDEDMAGEFGLEPAFVPEGKVFEDFEGKNYRHWKIEGQAFGNNPAKGGFSSQNPVSGHNGNGLVNSFLGGDKTTGKLVSPEFTIEHPYISFLIAGGNQPAKQCINLVIDGKVVHSTTGDNSERLNWAGWDVQSYKGQTAHLEIVDNHSQGWGHILVDEILFADQLAKPSYEKAFWLDYGKDNYAGVTWSNIPADDGRRLFLGWMSNWQYANLVPTQKWRSAMTLPRELRLDINGRLLSLPVKELEVLRQEKYALPTGPLEGQLPLSEKMPFSPVTSECILEFIPGQTGKTGLEVSNSLGEKILVGYDADKNSFFVDRSRAGKSDFYNGFAAEHFGPRVSKAQAIQLHLYFDVASVELFADGGTVTLTEIFFPNEDFNSIGLYVEGKGAEIIGGQIFNLK